MKKVSAVLITICIAGGIFMSTANAQVFSTNARYAVVLEAFYALRPGHDGGCDKTILGNCVSSWNFLNDPNQPTGAFQTVKTWYDQSLGGGVYSCLASDWA